MRDAASALKAEGIREEMYEQLAPGDVVTEQRPVPAGKTGVHLASFGIVRGPVDRLWNAITDCGRTPEFMPHIDSWCACPARTCVAAEPKMGRTGAELPYPVFQKNRQDRKRSYDGGA